MQMKNRVGERYGRLTVIRRCEGPRAEDVYWTCRCDCGNSAVVTSRNLRSGNSTSCGCYHNEKARERRTTHGATHTVEYETLKRMIARCENPKAPEFSRYGGRGIYVCDRWRRSFEAFVADMGPRPSAEHSIDRIDNNGPYAPGNCRWATRIQQARNKRNNRPVGDAPTITAAAEAIGMNSGTAWNRLRRNPTPASLLEPLRANSAGRMISFRGKTHNIAEWSRQTGLNTGTLFARLKYGWTVERTLTQPPSKRLQVRSRR